MHCVGWNVVNVSWNDVGVLELLEGCVSPRCGFSARRSRPHESWSSGQRTGRSERKSRGTRDRGRRQNKETTNAQTCDDMCMNIFLCRHVVRHLEPQCDVFTRIKVSRKTLVWGVSVYRDLIYSLLLSSLNFSHFVHISDLSISKNFSFIDNSSCIRTSRLDSTNPYCASCNANLCSSVCRCSSPMHLLRDSTWSSCIARSDLAWLSKWSLLPSRRDPLKFDGSAFLNTELLIKFPCSEEYNASGFPKAFWPSVRPQTFFSGLSRLCTYLPLSPAWPMRRVSPKLSGHTVVKSATFVTLHLRDQSPQCFSAESSKCVCD